MTSDHTLSALATIESNTLAWAREIENVIRGFPSETSKLDPLCEAQVLLSLSSLMELIATLKYALEGEVYGLSTTVHRLLLHSCLQDLMSSVESKRASQWHSLRARVRSGLGESRGHASRARKDCFNIDTPPPSRGAYVPSKTFAQMNTVGEVRSSSSNTKGRSFEALEFVESVKKMHSVQPTEVDNSGSLRSGDATHRATKTPASRGSERRKQKLLRPQAHESSDLQGINKYLSHILDKAE